MNVLKMMYDVKVFIVVFDMILVILCELGLQESDVLEVYVVVQWIEVGSLQIVVEFGCDVVEYMFCYVDSLLDQVCNSDLDEVGEKLIQVVVKVCFLNVGFLFDNCFCLFLIGLLIDCFCVCLMGFMVCFDMICEQIEYLVSEVQIIQ